MDLKHAMLYQEEGSNTPHIVAERAQGQAAGTSTATEGTEELPPTYDEAMSAPARTLSPTAPATSASVVDTQPLPTTQQQQTTVHPDHPNLGPDPSSVLCSRCREENTTRMTHVANNLTHLAAALLCLVGWCCCACFVPYCMNSCRTGHHYCAKCNAYQGTYSPRGLK